MRECNGAFSLTFDAVLYTGQLSLDPALASVRR